MTTNIRVGAVTGSGAVLDTLSSVTVADTRVRSVYYSGVGTFLLTGSQTDENEEGKTVTTRWLQTRIGQNYIAKDRSGKLDGFESPDLASVINKLGFAGGAA